jgi:hypothetical protein
MTVWTLLLLCYNNIRKTIILKHHWPRFNGVVQGKTHSIKIYDINICSVTFMKGSKMLCAGLFYRLYAKYNNLSYLFFGLYTIFFKKKHGNVKFLLKRLFQKPIRWVEWKIHSLWVQIDWPSLISQFNLLFLMLYVRPSSSKSAIEQVHQTYESLYNLQSTKHSNLYHHNTYFLFGVVEKLIWIENNITLYII